MALDSYANLKTALPAWLWGRSDLTSYLDDFIDLAEARFNRLLRTREMEATTDLTPSSGAVTLPDDFLGVRKVTAKASPRRELKYATPEWLEEAYPSGDSGDPSWFTVIGSSLKTYPQSTSDIELVYFQKVPALTDANTSNWLLAKSPQAYLHATVLEAAIFIGDQARAVEMGTLLERDLLDLMREDPFARSGRATIRAGGPTP